MVGIEDKSFENFLKLASKLRVRIIDKMQPNDRCRFTRCSTLCYKEARTSKNYIHEIGITSSSHAITISFIHEKYEFFLRHGFSLKFLDLPTRKVMRYRNLSFQTLWEIELYISTDLEQCAIETFKSALRNYERIIKKDVDLNIQSLDNLEELDINIACDIQQILSKLQKPLKTLIVSKEENNELVENCEQMYQVEQKIHLWHAQLNNTQFLRLTAREVCMPIGKLNERDIHNFIKSWQNGTIGKQIEVYRWYCSNSNFDKQKLWKLLRVEDSEIEQSEIKHFNEPGRSAILCYDDDTLDFHMNNENFS